MNFKQLIWTRVVGFMFLVCEKVILNVILLKLNKSGLINVSKKLQT